MCSCLIRLAKPCYPGVSSFNLSSFNFSVVAYTRAELTLLFLEVNSSRIFEKYLTNLTLLLLCQVDGSAHLIFLEIHLLEVQMNVKLGSQLLFSWKKR